MRNVNESINQTGEPADQQTPNRHYGKRGRLVSVASAVIVAALAAGCGTTSVHAEQTSTKPVATNIPPKPNPAGHHTIRSTTTTTATPETTTTTRPIPTTTTTIPTPETTTTTTIPPESGGSYGLSAAETNTDIISNLCRMYTEQQAETTYSRLDKPATHTNVQPEGCVPGPSDQSGETFWILSNNMGVVEKSLTYPSASFVHTTPGFKPTASVDGQTSYTFFDSGKDSLIQYPELITHLTGNQYAVTAVESLSFGTSEASMQETAPSDQVLGMLRSTASQLLGQGALHLSS